MHTVGAVLTWAYYAVCLTLTVLGTYRVTLLLGWLRRARGARPRCAPPAEWPRVTVQLPLYNERYVACRLLRAVAALDYPRELLEVQVLDDSTDRTLLLTRRLVGVLRRRGLQVQHLHREARDGFKAGALAAGLVRARGELVAIFDADFVPQPDFLRRIVPHVLQPGVGAVQARWGYLNREKSWFTRLQSILLDGHFAIEQPSRSWNGFFLSFNGTCGVWRRRAIEAAGGWSSDTLTEDLDLSIRAQLAGWRIVYLDDLVVPGELPEHSNSFRSQQRRWTKGGVQVARKLLPRILAAPLPPRVKLEAMLHLTCYACYPLLVLLVLLRAPARVFGPPLHVLGLLPGEIPLLMLSTLPIVAFYVLAQRAVRAPGGLMRWTMHALAASALGAGLAVSNGRAVLEGLFGKDLRFERTPKLGGVRPRRSHATYRIVGVGAAALELAVFSYLVAFKIFWTGWRSYTDYPFLLLFGFGLLSMSVPSIGAALGPVISARRAVPARRRFPLGRRSG